MGWVAERKAEVVTQLVSSGMARPGQTGWAILDSMAFDVMADIAYTMILDQVLEQGGSKEQLDSNLAKLDVNEKTDSLGQLKTRKVTRRDGKIVWVSEERWQRLVNNNRTANKAMNVGNPNKKR